MLECYIEIFCCHILQKLGENSRALQCIENILALSGFLFEMPKNYQLQIILNFFQLKEHLAVNDFLFSDILKFSFKKIAFLTESKNKFVLYSQKVSKKLSQLNIPPYPNEINCPLVKEIIFSVNITNLSKLDFTILDVFLKSKEMMLSDKLQLVSIQTLSSNTVFNFFPPFLNMSRSK